MNNLELYNKFKSVPDSAKKAITAGRLKGKTDINPMWRIKMLTEQFGPCGVGWYPEIVDQWIEQGADGTAMAFVKINLFVKIDGEWSKPIVGIGGSMAIAKESNGKYTDDECYKKAYTDAISVSCKMLGIAADVYYEKDSTKYDATPTSDVICPVCKKKVASAKINGDVLNPEQVLNKIGMCASCYKTQKETGS